jgi:heptosyltransferase II
VLLGGPEDHQRNPRVASACAVRRPLESPTDEGLRRGLQLVDACDVVVSGDSLGMHMAIGLGKPVVAWFGPTPHAEIELYGRGAWVLADVDCRPCMRSTCDLEPKCFLRVPLEAMADQVAHIVTSLMRGEAWSGEVRIGDPPTWPPRRSS